MDITTDHDKGQGMRELEMTREDNMAKCIKCGREVSDEESKARYQEIMEKYNMIPKMITICKKCREGNK